LKNFVYLLCIPVSLLFCILFFIIVADENGFEVYREVPLHSYCSSSDDYVKCVFNNSAVGNFAESVLREPIADLDSAKGDKGGCDRAFLTGWRYTNKAYDYSNRKRFLDACNPYISNAYHLGRGLSKELMNNKWWDKSLVTDANIKPSDSYMTNRNLQEFKKYIQNPYLTKDESGNVKSEVIEWAWLDKKPSFMFKGNIFSYWLVLLALLPTLIAIGIFITLYKKLEPIFSKSTFNWIKSKRKFRASLLISFVWIFPWFIILNSSGRGLNPLDNSDAWLFYCFGLYPLVSILCSYFIVTAED